MQVSNTSSASSFTADSAAAAGRVSKKTLGQEDFLKLLTVQLAKQDPMKPMEDTAFIAQMAQFTSLEQSTQLTKEFSQFRSDSQLTSASALLGKKVTVEDADRQLVSGEVAAVDNTSGAPQLLINGQLYKFTSVKGVSPLPTPTTAG